MNAPTPHPLKLPEATAFADACAQIVGSLLLYIFHRMHALGPSGIEVYRRINRAHHRIQRLMAKLAAGKWRDPKPRSPDTSRSEVAPKATAVSLENPGALPLGPRPAKPTVSRAYNWLGQRYDYFIRGYFCQLEHLINTPESLALYAAAPPAAIKSLGRTLRPLCHMFAITPPALMQAPKRIRPPRPPKPRAERKPRPPTSNRMLRRALKSCLKPKGMAIWPDRIAARRKTD